MRTTHLATIASFALALVACGGGQATVKHELANATPGVGLAALRLPDAASKLASDAVYAAPTMLEVKLVAVYLSEDIDAQQNNVGANAMIYLNPECAGDISSCGVDPSMPHVVQTFFDFAAPSDEVNAAINAQGNAISVGTFRYARMEFCKYGTGGTENLRWQTSAMPAPAEDVYPGCGTTSAPFDVPLVLAAGDSVAVTLSYDLSTAAMIGSPGVGDKDVVDTAGNAHVFQYCHDDSGVRSCLQIPDFNPSPSPL